MRLYQDQPSGTVPRARQLRRDAPDPERRLLRALREAFPEHKWRHQAPIGPFFADILCFSEALVIEVDGPTHTGTAGRGATRTAAIVARGFRVIRFTNDEVTHNLDGVLATIQSSLSLWEREGAHRVSDGKGEGEDGASDSPPSPFRRFAAPSLSQREREKGEEK